ncbi:MAG: hypothetical protein KF685_08100 [Acidobacteria bacterium]|nr:hypothetical protein [Acidobacteriota bacterium]
MTHSKRSPLIIAHRGASAVAPENTLAAFRHAIEAGADGIELDVRLASDGVAVVIHDQDLKRTAGFEGRVSSYSSDELSHFDVGSWFRRKRSEVNGKFSDQKVLSLRSTLAAISDFRGFIYIEMKCRNDDAEALAKAVAEDIAASETSGTLIVKSFKMSAVSYIRRYCPEVRTAALFAPKIRTLLRKEKYLVKIAHELGVNELSLHYSLVTRKLMKKAAKRGLPVTVWTADNPRWVKRAMKLGLNAIITNDPERLLKRRSELTG